MANFTPLMTTPAEFANGVYAQVSAMARTLKLEGIHILSRTNGSQVELLVSRELAAYVL